MQGEEIITITKAEFEQIVAERLLLAQQMQVLADEKLLLLDEKQVLLVEKKILLEDNQLLRETNVHINFRLEQLLRTLFGRKSERFLPNTSENGAGHQLSFLFEGEQLTAEQEETVGQLIAAHERKKPKIDKKPHPGRTIIPEHLPRKTTILEPQEDTTGMVRIGEDVTETLEYTPAEIWVNRFVRPRYLRPQPNNKTGEEAAKVEEKIVGQQDDVLAEELSPIIQAPAPELPMGRSKAGASFIAHILYSKYVEHLPLHRLIQRYLLLGLSIAQATIAGWVKTGIQPLELLYQHYEKFVFDANYLQMDETHLKVLEDGKGKTHKGYIWAVFDPLGRHPFFRYHPGRDAGLPKLLLKNFQGVLQSDGYSVYEAIKNVRLDTIVLVNCLAHIRRKFFDAKKNDPKRAEEALAIIGEMYKVEAIARHLSHSERLALRQKDLAPLFDLFDTWLKHNRAATTPSSPIGQAITYALSQFPSLKAALLDGRIEVDNNLVENIIRPIAIGRKNYLFAGSHEAAQRTAIIYTFFAACKHANINPEIWLNDVLLRINDTKISQLHNLFPHNWKPNS